MADSEGRAEMTLSPVAVATAHRNLAQRIKRFIDALDQEKRQPTRWQGAHVLSAIEMLHRELYRGGENCMLRAERASVSPSPKPVLLFIGDAPTARELRARLDRALSGEG